MSDATDLNTPLQDIASDLNTARPVIAGGTGATTASGARTNLGLVIGTDVQGYHAGLGSIAGLTTAADKGIYTTGSDTYATFDLTSYARTLLDDPDAATARATLDASQSPLDEDDMASDSATRPATQQSVKAYVDSRPLASIYESGEQTIASGGALTLAHSLGAQPKLVQCYLRCKTAQHGYSVNDEVLLSWGGEFNKGLSVVPDATNLNIRFGSDATGAFQILEKNTGNSNQITNANWRLLVKAWV